ncbi:unnamed protein product [Parascedosporium putredinis]|uniref:Uncharacterized protein n=1 Tax=Parascedosporium putredinis TaxID=1442378 RepID=A0A9P1M996_9PEZI|nr:unnamed protein product [Parascedosporium putredinis]CAI7994229.1 unnamed protein product [Parascedosporium putredinis]
MDVTESQLSIAIAGPGYSAVLGNVTTSPDALRHLSIRRREFTHLLASLRIHPMFLDAVADSSPLAMRHECQLDGNPAIVYILRVSNSISQQSAIAVTQNYRLASPGSKSKYASIQVSALVLGYDDSATRNFEACLRKRKESVFEARSVVMAFLEVEKERRFLEVRKRRAGLREILHKISSLSALAEPPLPPPERHRKVDDNIGLYLEASALRVNGLQAWKRQIISLQAEADAAGDRALASSLARLVLQYEHRIERCDVTREAASLAYQMETSYLARSDTRIAIKDAKIMRVVAVFTVLFLPATFTATFMAVPQIEEAINGLEMVRKSHDR